MANPTPDFDDLVKQIKPTLSTDKQAAAVIALRLIRSQSQYDLTSFGNNFPILVNAISAAISNL